MFEINIKETESNEHTLAWLAYEMIYDNKINYRHKIIFGKEISKEELIKMIIASKIISFRCLIDCHRNLNGKFKTILLNNIADNKELIGEFIRKSFSTSYFKVTTEEYKILFPIILDNYSEYMHLIYHALDESKDRNKFIKSMKLNSTQLDKLTSRLVMKELSNN